MEKKEIELRAKINGQERAFPHGLSKREHFAGLALQAIISSGDYSEMEAPCVAVNFADALLIALKDNN